MALIADGNERAFELFFSAHHHQLGSFAYQLTASRTLAEEVVQEVFIEVWLKRRELPQVASIKNYLFILTRNRALNALRKIANDKLKHAVWAQYTPTYEETTAAEDPIEVYNHRLQEAITKLPLQQQKVFRMSKIERLKQEEIARILNLSPETVKKHMKLALRFLRSYLSTNIDKPILLLLLGNWFR
ncbi:RNA polymerase sigma-70 factor [Olivibacter ginsenosidimutans]|uniref:RNA polymerase sigma-70 factor n=1 Tax=Olivibacter ginsenosidimutans TaxID=1176537 RepID=A0ABP9CG77_9SPHI